MWNEYLAHKWRLVISSTGRFGEQLTSSDFKWFSTGAALDSKSLVVACALLDPPVMNENVASSLEQLPARSPAVAVGEELELAAAASASSRSALANASALVQMYVSSRNGVAHGAWSTRVPSVTRHAGGSRVRAVQ